MSRWWRAEDTSIDHPKLLLLSDAMHRAWYTLMCVASANGGELPPVEHVAARLRMKPGQVAAWITHLVTAGLFDNDDGTFRPHNWNKRQYKTDVTDATNAERQKRYRNAHRNGSNAVTDKRPETEQIQNTETEAEKKDPPLRSDDWPKDYGDIFWLAYPRKTEKLSAMKKLATIRKSGIVTFSDMMAGVRRYAASGTDPQFTKHPTTWLNAGCWSDEIQSGGGYGQRTANSGKTRSDAILAAATREARKIVGDGEVAGSAVETELSFGDGSFGGATRGHHGSVGAASSGDDGGKPFAGTVLEGEVIAPDETNAGLPGGWRVIG
jgi:hypothetical protein